MQWSDFVQQVREQLRLDNGLEHVGADFDKQFDKEHHLTREVALGLRRLFSESFGVPSDPTDLHYHVVYRNGDSDEDKKAWNFIKNHKWIPIRGLNYVPDVLVFRKRLKNPTDPATEVLPIEVKLVKQRACSAELARAVGQCLAYSVRYPKSIVFVGVQRGALYGNRGLRNVAIERERSEDIQFKEKLERNGITLIFRDVGRVR